jgi:hypothetical protein
MATWQDRWRDVEGFWRLAETGYDRKPGYANPAASNALLAVIAANDAVCRHLGRRQPKGESHIQAADYLKSACKGTQWEKEASEKSRQALAMPRQKTAVQYLGRPLPADRIETLMKQAERFLECARSVLPVAEA